MKVFLVAATGGLGGHVLRQLLQKDGVDVVAYVRTPAKLSNLRHPRLELIQGELSTLHASAMRGCDVVVSAHSSDRRERHIGYQTLVEQASQAGVPCIIGVGGAGQLLGEDGRIKQTDPNWFPGLAPVTEDHQRGLAAVRESSLQWTWVAPSYMPTDAPSA